MSDLRERVARAIAATGGGHHHTEADWCDWLVEADAAIAAGVGAVPGGPWRVGSHYGIHVYAGDVPVATFHRAEDAARAVAAVNAAVPVGWRLVPVEPTQGMLAAGGGTSGMAEVDRVIMNAAARSGGTGLGWLIRGEKPPLAQAWAAMLDVAPTPPGPLETGEE
jgi:hypothetical protein